MNGQAVHRAASPLPLHTGPVPAVARASSRPYERSRLPERPTVVRVNGRLKDEFGGRWHHRCVRHLGSFGCGRKLTFGCG